MKKCVLINNVKANISVSNRAEVISEYITSYPAEEEAPCPYTLVNLDPMSMFDDNKPSPVLVTFESYEKDPRRLEKENIFNNILADIMDPLFAQVDKLEVMVIDESSPKEAVDAFKERLSAYPHSQTESLESVNSLFSGRSTTNNIGYGLTPADLIGVEDDLIPSTESVEGIPEPMPTESEPEVTDNYQPDIEPETETPEPVDNPITDIEVPAPTPNVTPVVSDEVKYCEELVAELKRLNQGELPPVNSVASALLWFMRDKATINDSVSEEDYSYQNAIPYIERPVDENTQYIATNESTDNITYLVDKKDLDDVRKNVMSDLTDAIGDFLSGGPKAASILTIKECRSFMRKVNRCGLKVINKLVKTAFVGVNSGYKSKIKYTNDICENYQTPPIVTSDVVRGLAIPVLSSTMTMEEVKAFFSNTDLVDKVYRCIMDEVYGVILDAKLVKYSSLHYICFRQNPNKHYLVIIIETGVKIVSQDEKDAIVAAAKAPNYEDVNVVDEPNVEPSMENVSDTTPTTPPNDDNMNSWFLELLNDESKPESKSADPEPTDVEPEVNSDVEETVEEPRDVESESNTNSTSDDLDVSLEGMDLVRELAKSVETDDELFDKMCQYKDKIGVECLNDALNYNMLVFVKDGLKMNNNPTVQNKRLVKSFSW